MLFAARLEPIRGCLIGLCVVVAAACGGASVRPDDEGIRPDDESTTGGRDAAAPNTDEPVDAGAATPDAAGGRDAQTALDASSSGADAGGRDATAGGRDASSNDASSSSDGGTPASDAGVELSDGGPALRWLGRVEKTAQGARFTWSGTGFVARFRGTALSARIKIAAEQPDYFQLVVDGESYGISSKNEWVLELPPGPHRLEARTQGNTISWKRIDVRESAPETVLLSLPVGTDGLLGGDAAVPEAEPAGSTSSRREAKRRERASRNAGDAGRSHRRRSVDRTGVYDPTTASVVVPVPPVPGGASAVVGSKAGAAGSATPPSSTTTPPAKASGSPPSSTPLPSKPGAAPAAGAPATATPARPGSASSPDAGAAARTASSSSASTAALKRDH